MGMLASMMFIKPLQYRLCCSLRAKGCNRISRCYYLLKKIFVLTRGHHNLIRSALMDNFDLLLTRVELSEGDTRTILGLPEASRIMSAKSSKCLDLLIDLSFDVSVEVKLALLENPAISNAIIELLQNDANAIVALKATEIGREQGNDKQ